MKWIMLTKNCNINYSKKQSDNSNAKQITANQNIIMHWTIAKLYFQNTENCMFKKYSHNSGNLHTDQDLPQL